MQQSGVRCKLRGCVWPGWPGAVGLHALRKKVSCQRARNKFHQLETTFNTCWRKQCLPTNQLRPINSSQPESLQYLQHIQRRHIMGTFKEVVCGSLIVITFAAILYSVPL
jgi:hypothetical protein